MFHLVSTPETHNCLIKKIMSESVYMRTIELDSSLKSYSGSYLDQQVDDRLLRIRFVREDPFGLNLPFTLGRHGPCLDKLLVGSSEPGQYIVVPDGHQNMFMKIVQTAFSFHCGLQLRPDNFYHLLLQGFSKFVRDLEKRDPKASLKIVIPLQFKS